MFFVCTFVDISLGMSGSFVFFSLGRFYVFGKKKF